MAYIDVSLLAGISILAGIDPITRDFYFSAATANTEIHPMDVYKEMRICRRLDENLRGFELFVSGNGREPKGAGKFTERFVKQLLETRFVPYDITSFITIIGTVITDDGQEGTACFDRTGLANQVDINYVPPQVEVIEVSSGSGLDAGQDAKLTNIDTNTTYANKIINNYKEVIEILGVKYLVIYDDGETSGGVEILRKPLKDVTGADIADLAIGTLAVEQESSA